MASRSKKANNSSIKKEEKKNISNLKSSKSILRTLLKWFFFPQKGLVITLFFLGLLFSAIKPNYMLSSIFYTVEEYVHSLFFEYDNLELGVPGQADKIINRQGYALGYSNKYKQPLWVIYKLTADEVNSEKAKRQDDFQKDPLIYHNYAELSDYRYSDFDRGHMAAAADMKWSNRAMRQSFYLSNMSPQNSSFNRGIWRKLENRTRVIARKEGIIYVITGPIFSKNKRIKTIGKNKVAVPTAFFKVIYDTTPPQKMIGFVVPNKKGKGNLTSYTTAVYEIEDLTNLVFFQNIPHKTNIELKNKITIKDWEL